MKFWIVSPVKNSKPAKTVAERKDRIKWLEKEGFYGFMSYYRD
jgi:hypothetical protein